MSNGAAATRIPPPKLFAKWFIIKVFCCICRLVNIVFVNQLSHEFYNRLFVPYCLPAWDQIPPNGILFGKKKVQIKYTRRAEIQGIMFCTFQNCSVSAVAAFISRICPSMLIFVIQIWL